MNKNRVPHLLESSKGDGGPWRGEEEQGILRNPAKAKIAHVVLSPDVTSH